MRLLLAGALALGLALPAQVGAQSQAPITLVVNFVAGGPTDLMARILAPGLSAALGTSVVIKNSAGAAGGIGAAEVARARADGATLLLSPIGAMAIQPHFRSDLPYRPADFAPICQVADTPVVVMSAPDSPIRDVPILLSRAREARGAFNFGSTGPGSLPHIATVALARAADVEMTHVPYRGNAEAVTALLRGDVSIFADQPGTLRGNNLRAVAVLSERRVPEFPDTPTLREQGLDIVYSIWSGLFAPAATPPEFLARAEAACRSALASPAVIAGFDRLATPIVFRGQRDFSAFWAAEFEKFRGIVQAAGLRPGD